MALQLPTHRPYAENSRALPVQVIHLNLSMSAPIIMPERGPNYTAFYSENAVGPTSVSPGDRWGRALQADFDIDVSENIFLNLDVKYIDLDPFVFGVGTGFRLQAGRFSTAGRTP